MSHRSPTRGPHEHGHHPHGHAHAHHQHQHGQLRAQPKLTKPPAPAKSGWTLGHGGRQVRLGPVAFWIIVGSLVVMAGWSAMTATYFAFRDDVLTRLLARQAQMQYAYEDRIAELRGQVDRLASRQLLDQEQVESKLEPIARRQATLESRSSALSSLPDLDHDRLDQARAARHARNPCAAERRRSPRRSTTRSSWCRRPSARRGLNRARRSTPASSSLRCRRTAASKARWRGCRSRSTASRRSRTRRSTRWRKTTTPRRGGCATSSPTSASISARSRRRCLRARAADRSCPPPRSGVAAFDRQLYRIRLVRGQVERLTRTLEHRADPQADDGRTGLHIRLWHAHRSVHARARDAYRPRYPRRYRRAGARDRGRHRHDRGLERRLRQDGRGRPRQRLRDALRASLGDRRGGRATRSASGRSSAASAQPDARPARICTTKRASTATRSIRRNSCARACGWAGCCNARPTPHPRPSPARCRTPSAPASLP